MILDQCATTGSATFCDLITRYEAPPSLKYHVLEIKNLLTNVGEESYNGVDFYMNYDSPDLVNGWNYSLGYLIAYTNKFEETILGTATEYAGTQVEDKFGLIPEIRASGYMTWSKDFLSIEYNLRYIGEAEEENYGGTLWDVDSIAYHDVKFNFSIGDNFLVTLGINNILGTEPPFVDSAFNGNTSLENYDMSGQFKYLRLSMSF